ncbi:MAG: hypothetical protein MJ137_03190, partial [Clostridia bacterium]|nr:hypothetical protein [Clostridia bacterium]
TRGTSSSTWYSRDIFADGVSGDIIADAVYTRNSRMEEKYGFKVEEFGSKNPATDAVNSINGGSDDYGMYCFKVKDDITSLLLKGYLYNLNNVSSMNLDAPYYDQNSRRDFSIAGKLYLVTGDLLTMDNDATRCCLFNKALFNELSISNEIGGSLYDLMKDGTWTQEVMAKCAEIATTDLDGNGVMDLNDRYGMVSEQFNAVSFYNAAGRLIYQKDQDDVPFFAANTEDGLQVFSDVITMLNQPFCRHYSNAYNEAIPQFKEGIVLFYPAQLADVPLLREMEFDFGIVPLPKYSADQDSYHSTVTTYGSNCIAIPTTVKNVERSAVIIEVLSCESMYVLTPAYYELNLKSKLVRDAESGPAIDIILKTACYELGYMWNWGGIYGAVTGGFNNNNPNLTTSFKSVEKLAKKAIENDVETIRGIDH